MNLTFSNDRSSVTSYAHDPLLVSKLNSTLINFPKILDGMGEKVVICDCKKCKPSGFAKFAEVIIFEWTANGNKYEKAFSGYNSYFIQNIIHKLESMNQG